MPVLRIGYSSPGYQYGSGLRSGWELVNEWIKNVDVETLHWITTWYTCPTCGEAIMGARVPAPVSIVILRCRNGHKYCYENTD